MKTLVTLEMKKMLLKPSMVIITILSMAFGFVVIREGSVAEVYADMFLKTNGITVIMTIAMCMIFAGVYTLEYNSNMADLIKSTTNGTNTIVKVKAIAAGICASIVNLLIYIFNYSISIN